MQRVFFCAFSHFIDGVFVVSAWLRWAVPLHAKSNEVHSAGIEMHAKYMAKLMNIVGSDAKFHV